MALALRLRRAIAAASTSAPLLLRPVASASIFRPLSPVPFVPVPIPLPRSWLLPGATAGFRSTAAAADNDVSPDEIPANGLDYNYWLITMEFPDPKPSREEMIETYLQMLATVVGSYEEAKRRMYAFSTTTYTGFQARMTREMSEEFYWFPGVLCILPDAYIYPERKQYGGDKYDNGVITPFLPRYYWGKSSRPDRNHTFQRNNQTSLHSK